MKLKIDGVNKAGTGFISSDVWYNQADRKAAPQFKGLWGKEIEVELNGDTTFVTSFKVLSNGDTNGVSKEAYKAPFNSRKTDPDDAVRMGRASAASTVYSSPLIKEYLATRDLSEGISILKELREELANYIMNGKKEEVK